MIDYEELKKSFMNHISSLQSEINDLKWRMNEFCKKKKLISQKINVYMKTMVKHM